ncbi:MAG: CcmD family protein [Ignavibacteria bacterium]
MDNFYNFLNKNSYYVVLIIILLIWIGIYLYLRSMSRKVSKLEK